MAESNTSSKKRKCVIEEVYVNNMENHTAHPILVTFASPAPKDTPMTAKLSHELYTGIRDRNYLSKVTIQAGDQEYTGLSTRCHPSHYDPNDDGMMTFLGVLNKTTNKMKLVELQKFVVRKTLTPEALARLNSQTELPQTNVTMAFGTKKNIKKYEAHLKQKERQESADVSAMDQMISSIDNMEQAPLPLPETAEFDFALPPVNEAATHPKAVYHMSSIVSDDVLEELLPMASEMLEGTMPENENTSLLITTSLAAAKLEVDEHVQLRHACAILFMMHLAKLAAGHRIPDRALLSDKFIRHLYYKYRFKMDKPTVPRHCRDKALANLLVLAMLINKWRLPMTTVTGSVAVDRTKILHMAKLLRLSTKAGNFYIRIPLPDDVTKKLTKISLRKKK